MNQFQQYLLDEFADDYRSGRMSRRDFVVKAIGVAGGLAAASGLFAGLGLSAAEVALAQTTCRGHSRGRILIDTWTTPSVLARSSSRKMGCDRTYTASPAFALAVV